MKVLSACRKLKGTGISIGEDFSPRVRDVRKKLWPFVKEKRSKNERAAMVYDHIFMDGKKFTIGADGSSLVEMR